MDIIACELGLDPVEMRLKNAMEDGDKTPAGGVLTNVCAKETLHKAAEVIDRGAKPAQKNRGRGIALEVKRQIVLVEHPADSRPFGAKGMGEPPIIAPPAVIANAVYEAVGVRIRDLPLTAEKVLTAILRRRSSSD